MMRMSVVVVMFGSLDGTKVPALLAPTPTPFVQ
jgi:hypothetical protein